MLQNNQDDIFDAEKCPEMKKELWILQDRIAHLPDDFRSNIIISYLKNHSLKNIWIDANPGLTKLITSNACATKHIESVFNLNRTNERYIKDYELYIQNVLSSNA